VRFRIGLAVIILLFDIFFAPFLCLFPYYAKSFGFKDGLYRWKADINKTFIRGSYALQKGRRKKSLALAAARRRRGSAFGPFPYLRAKEKEN